MIIYTLIIPRSTSLWLTFLCPRSKFLYLNILTFLGNFNHTPKFKLNKLFLLYLPLQSNVIHSPKCVWGPGSGGDAVDFHNLSGSSIPPFHTMSTVRHQCMLSCVWLCNPMDWGSPGLLLSPWDFSGKNTGKDCHFLLQGVFPLQGLNLCLLHCKESFTCWVTAEARRHKYLRLLYFLLPLPVHFQYYFFLRFILGLLLTLFCITRDWPLKTVFEAQLDSISFWSIGGGCAHMETWRPGEGGPSGPSHTGTQSHRDPNILCLPGCRILFILLP